MISSTLGAPLGGTIRGSHQGVDSDARSLMVPPNFGSGAGSCLPLIEVVAWAEPSSPVTSCAMPDEACSPKAIPETAMVMTNLIAFMRALHLGIALLTSASHAVPPARRDIRPSCPKRPHAWRGLPRGQCVQSGKAINRELYNVSEDAKGNAERPLAIAGGAGQGFSSAPPGAPVHRAGQPGQAVPR